MLQTYHMDNTWPIKVVLFLPLPLQYLPDMLLVLVLDDSHILSGYGPKISPIYLLMIVINKKNGIYCILALLKVEFFPNMRGLSLYYIITIFFSTVSIDILVLYELFLASFWDFFLLE